MKKQTRYPALQKPRQGDMFTILTLPFSHPPPGLTPLHAAAAGGHLEVADELISAGADVRRQAFVGSMPRHVAEREGHGSMVELLANAARSLEAGGFLESVSERGGKHGWYFGGGGWTNLV